MTIEEVQAAKVADVKTIYTIELNDKTSIKALIQGPYSPVNHPQGYTHPYIHTTQIETGGAVKTIYCKDISSITS
jgi:hypothetical protein